VDLRGSYGMLGEAFHDTEAFEDGKASIDPEKEWFLGVAGSVPFGVNSFEYEQIKHVYGPTVLSLTGSEDWRHHLAFNLFDRMGAVTDEKQAQYALLQAESEYKDVRDEVTLRLRDEFYSLQRYLIQIDSSIAKLRYQNKQITILEYLLNLQETSRTVTRSSRPWPIITWRFRASAFWSATRSISRIRGNWATNMKLPKLPSLNLKQNKRAVLQGIGILMAVLFAWSFISKNVSCIEGMPVLKRKKETPPQREITQPPRVSANTT
jgi:hypothetical protein